MKRTRVHLSRRYIIFVLLPLSFIFHQFGLLDRMFTVLIIGNVERQNTAFLDQSQKRASEMLTLSETIKGSLEVIKSAVAGLSLLGSHVDLQVGKIVAAASGEADLLWKTLLANSSILFGLELILKTANWLSKPLITTSILTAFFWYCFHCFGRIKLLKRITIHFLEILLVLSFTLYLLIPLVIAGSAGLAHAITKPIHKELQTALNKSENQLTPIHEKIRQRIIPSPSPAQTAEEAELVAQLNPKSLSGALQSGPEEGILQRIEEKIENAFHVEKKEIEELAEKTEQVVIQTVHKTEDLVKVPIHEFEGKLHTLHELILEADAVLQHHQPSLSSIACRLIVVYIFEVFLFPLGILYFLVKFLKIAFRHLCGHWSTKENGKK